MNRINRFCILGRLKEDPKYKELESGKKVANICVVTEREYKNTDGETITDFLNFTLWDKQAENINKISKKGDIICLDGIMTTKKVELTEGARYFIEPVVEKYRHIASVKNMDHDDKEVNKSVELESEEMEK